MSDYFDRLIARAERRDRDVRDTCPDAAVLAAYLDGTLAPGERAMVEAHAADCSRCALQLATIVRLEDESGEPRSAPADAPLWRRLLWTVPVATAALAVIIYLALPSRPPLATLPGESSRAPVEESTPARTDKLAPPASAPADALRDEAHRADTPAPPPATRKQRLTRPGERQSEGSAPGQEARATAENRSTDSARIAASRIMPQAPPPAAVVVGEADSAEPELRKELKAESDARAKTADTVAAEAPAGAPAAREGSVREVGARVSKAAVLTVQTADARVRWRAIDSRIERSTDGGVTWAHEPSPAALPLTMGAAPSADVCWLASPSGQVLRRMETGAWADVSPAPLVPIAQLTASSADSAAIVTTDGTRLLTTDAGRTWVREERRQERRRPPVP